MAAIAEKWFFLLSLSLLSLITSVSCHRHCPLMCRCSYQNNGIKVYCKSGSITKIPRLSSNTSTFRTDPVPLTSIHANAFYPASNISSIHVESSELQSIDVKAFVGLKQLLSLTIHSKRSCPLHTQILSSLASVSSLRLTIGLNRFPSDVLCGLPVANNSLHLNLNTNNISILNISRCVAEHIPRLLTIDISSNPLQYINAMDFYSIRDVNLQELHLANCLITEVKAGVFQHLPQLRMVDLSGNKISLIPEGVFTNLHHLQSLILGGSKVRTLPQDIGFSPTLKRLTLRGNKNITWRFGSSFRGALSLHDIILSNFFLGGINTDYFVNLSNSTMSSLNIISCKMLTITPDSMLPLVNLVRLRINSISFNPELITNLSKAASKLKVQRLEFSRVGLKQINNTLFSSFGINNHVVSLDLSDNSMDTIDSMSFAPFKQVYTLDLHQNELTLSGMKKDSLHGMDALKILKLDTNNFQSVPRGDDLGIHPLLQNLSMNGNKIDHLQKIRGYPNLLHLELQNCYIKTIDKDTFSNTTNLLDLKLRNNLITTIKSQFFYSLQHLQYLTLKNNKITTLAEDSFARTHDLRLLVLDINSFSSIVPLNIVFKNLTKLHTLSLDNCHINHLPDGMFEGMHSLQYLSLSNNRISYWNPSVFRPFKVLRTLTLSGNKITVMNQSDIQYISSSLQEISVARNPFSCECEMFWFSQWMITSDINFLDLTRENYYTCASPPKHTGKSLLHYMVTADCLPRLGMKVTLLVSFGMGLMCAMLSLIIRYRWYIRYYLYMIRIGRTELPQHPHVENYYFDGFVCYHKSSLSWIINIFLPEIEYRGGHKLCLSDRNWPVGHAIVDTVVSSVRHSRKTIILITNQFARSAWCREITEIAFNELVTQQRDLLVLVVMEDIETRNMCPTLRNLLTTRPYITWQEGANKQSRFWHAIKSALNRPDNRA